MSGECRELSKDAAPIVTGRRRATLPGSHPLPGLSSDPGPGHRSFVTLASVAPKHHTDAMALGPTLRKLEAGGDGRGVCVSGSPRLMAASSWVPVRTGVVDASTGVPLAYALPTRITRGRGRSLGSGLGLRCYIAI